MKREIKKESGVISIMVLVTIFFFLAVLMGGFTVNSVKRKSQIKYNKEILEIYQMDEAEYYDKIIEKNRIYTDSNGDKAIIPGGFYVSNEDDEKTISTGLVVKDGDGNEYVWVPVTDSNSFERKDFTTTQATISQTSDLITNFKNSALKYGGFYVGRYEAGIRLDTEVTLSTNPKDKDAIPISKANAVVWNFVTQKNAAEVSRKLAAESTTVTSSLMNSIAWDRICSWLEESSNNVQTDSNDFGNYTNTLFDYQGACLTNGTTLSDGPGTKASGISAITTTKTSERNMKNNICDIAGNVAELTTESVSGSDTDIIKRGGSGSVDSNIEPAGYRKIVGKNDATYDTGFRVVLCIGKIEEIE